MQYKQEDLWQLFDVLPKELKSAILSEQTSDIIRKTGEDNGLDTEQISLLAGMAGDCLMGILPPNEIASNIISEIKIDSKKADKIAKTLTEELFYPLKDFLSVFYPNVKFAPGGKKVVKTLLQNQETFEKRIDAIKKNGEDSAEEITEEAADDERPRPDDSYREPI